VFIIQIKVIYIEGTTYIIFRKTEYSSPEFYFQNDLPFPLKFGQCPIRTQLFEKKVNDNPILSNFFFNFFFLFQIFIFTFTRLSILQDLL
jgi:hypothetical protein